MKLTNKDNAKTIVSDGEINTAKRQAQTIVDGMQPAFDKYRKAFPDFPFEAFRDLCYTLNHNLRPRWGYTTEDPQVVVKRAIVSHQLGGEAPKVGGLEISMDKFLEIVNVEGLEDLTTEITEMFNVSIHTDRTMPEWFTADEAGVISYDAAAIEKRYTFPLNEKQTARYARLQQLAALLDEHYKDGKGNFAVSEINIPGLDNPQPLGGKQQFSVNVSWLLTHDK